MSFIPDPNRFDPSRLRTGSDKDKYVAPSKEREPVSRPERTESQDERKGKFKEVLKEQEKEAKERTKKTGSEGESPLELAAQLAASKKATGQAIIIPDEKALSTQGVQELMPDILAALEEEAKKAMQQTSTISYAAIEASAKTEDAGALSQARAITASLAEQMIEQLVRIEKGDRTETTITLKYPPLFENVQIRIDQFHSAQKEFNLTFLNLTNPDARALIEMKANQETLRSQLIERGYTLHMVTIEPKVELAQPETFGQGMPSREQKREGDKREGQQPKK